MKVAFYGRYSSDNQRDASIEDQHRVVERWAETHGHQLVAKFSDAAVSGANTRLLNSLQEALRSAFTAPAPFDAIVVDQLSRLSRDVGDTDAIIKRLRFSGIRVIAVADGIDTGDDTTKVSVTVKSLVNELYLDDLRKTTKRGLDGRFLKGYATGGRTYGYRSEPVHEPGRADSHGQPIPIGYRITPEPNGSGRRGPNLHVVPRWPWRKGHRETTKPASCRTPVAPQHDLSHVAELQVRGPVPLQSPRVAKEPGNWATGLPVAASGSMGIPRGRGPENHRR